MLWLGEKWYIYCSFITTLSLQRTFFVTKQFARVFYDATHTFMLKVMEPFLVIIRLNASLQIIAWRY